MADLDLMKNDYDGDKNLSRIKKTINEETNAGAIRVGLQLDCKVLVNIYQKRLFVGTHFLVCSFSRNDSYA